MEEASDEELMDELIRRDGESLPVGRVAAVGSRTAPRPTSQVEDVSASLLGNGCAAARSISLAKLGDSVEFEFGCRSGALKTTEMLQTSEDIRESNECNKEISSAIDLL